MKFEVENNKYTINCIWESITLRDAIAITDIDIEEEKLKYLISSQEIEYEDELMKYIKDVLGILTDCPRVMLDKIDNIFLVVLFDMVKYIVNGLYFLNLETYKPIGIKEIKFKGRVYKMPESLIINDEEILAYKTSSKNIIDASNIVGMLDQMQNKGIKLMNLVAAIYLKEENKDETDEEIIALKSKLFMDLPMSVIWEVFFFTYYSLINYIIGSRLYLELENQKKIKKQLNSIRGYIRLQNKGLQEILERSKN